RGIEMQEQRSADPGEFSSLITAELMTDQKMSVAAGTIFGNDMPRLVRKGDCPVESRLDGVLMVFSHRDQPGVIGRVGTVFGKHRLNIAQMSVGRSADKPGGEAIGVLALDSQPPAEALAEVLALNEITNAWIVNLPAASETPSWMGG
ncbi:MAG: ACT domain-containing protein, partial [Patescibacteria group bacterium]|nr:ACT domain-containing protein [Patescibacteria group bacterium]